MANSLARAPSLHAACSPGEVRVAAWDGTLLDYALWRPGAPDGVGNLHRGRVSALAPKLGGCFVVLEGEASGFLPDTTRHHPLSEGSLVSVRVTRAAQGGKGPRLAMMAEELDDTGPVRLIRRGPGALERLAAAYPEAAIAIDDPAVIGLLPSLRARCTLVARGFAPEIEDAAARLAASTVALRGGGRMTIEPTAALVAIDLDAGGGLEGGGKAAAHAAFNRGAITALARQIRLRNLAGAIVVDFAGLSPRQRPSLAEALAAALTEDPVATRLVGFTGLGLAEIVRQRIHPPLHELLAGPHAAAIAALRAAVAAACPGAARLALQAAPDVAAALAGDTQMLAGLARSPAHGLIVRSEPSLAPCTWRLAAAMETAG